MAEFNERLRKVMKDNNITQSELCVRTGIHKAAMSQYVSGKFKPKQDNLYKISMALNVSPAWLMGYDCKKEFKETFDILEKSDLSEAQRVQKVANNINNMSDKDVEKFNEYLNKIEAHFVK